MADDEKGFKRTAEDLHLNEQIDQAKAITENDNTNMADDEKGFKRTAEDLHLNEQIDQAKAITENENTNMADDEKVFKRTAEDLHLNEQIDQAKAITENDNTNMASAMSSSDEKGFIGIAEDLHLNGQIDQAIAALLEGLKVYPGNIVMKDLLQQYQDAKYLKTQDENKETTHNETELEEKANIHNVARDIQKTEQKNVNDNLQIANNSIQMRLKVLIMEIDIIKTFCDKKLIENDDITFEKLRKLNVNNFKQAEDEMLQAENLSTELMRKVKTVVNKNTATTEVKKRKVNTEVPDYRSIVTVRGTKEDVINCILKAKKALENGKLDRAESLLLKAERILPTENARNLLQEVQAAKEPKQNSDRNTNRENEAKAEDRKLDKNQGFDEDKINNKTRASKLSSDEAMTSKTVTNDDDLTLEKKTELFINLAIDAMTSGEFEKARHYLNTALEKQPNEDISSFVQELLRYLQIQIGISNNRNERISLSRKDIELEVNKLLDKAEQCIICNNDLDKAEAILVGSWDMYKNQRTIEVLRKLLKARLALREKENRVDENFDNISKSYNMVNSALEKYANNNYDKAEKLLMEAAKLYPNNIIDKLLVEVRENKNKNNGFLAKYCNIM